MHQQDHRHYGQTRRPRQRRVRLLLGALLLCRCLPVNGAAAPVSSLGPAKTATGKIIKWGWDIPNTELVRRNVQRMEETGYDGIAIRFYADVPDADGNLKRLEMDNRWINAHLHTTAQLQRAIANLKATSFRRFTDNFIFMNANAGGGSAFWLEADHAAALCANLRLAAEICRATGLKGFLIDTEGYGGWTQLNSRYLLETRGLSIDQARDRVRQVMGQAAREVSRAYPEITVMIIYSGYRARDQHSEYPPLTSAFTDGWLKGLGPKATVVDLREQAYGCRTYADFREIASVFPGEAANSAYPELHRQRLKLGFGVWLDNRGRPGEYGGWYQDPDMNHFRPAEFAAALHYALRAGDGYVWVYSERAFAWPGAQSCANWDETNVPDAYFDAARDARRPRPLTAARHDRGAAAEPLPPPAASLPGYGDPAAPPAPGIHFESVTELDQGWEFWPDPGARSFDDRTAVFDVKKKELPDAPHPDWQPIRVGEFWERQGHRYNGLAWYRVRFNVPAAWQGKRVWLLFGAVADYCRIFFEGRGGLNWHPESVPLPLARQQGPQMEITDLVDYGRQNTMFMWVNNIAGPGGIWKPVRLAVSSGTTAE